MHNNAKIFTLNLREGLSVQFLLFINVMAIEEPEYEGQQVTVPVTALIYPNDMRNPDDVYHETMDFPNLKSAQSYINHYSEGAAMDTANTMFSEH